MNIEDIIIPAGKIETEKWQLGNLISGEIAEGGIVLIFCSDYRGLNGGDAEIHGFRKVRRELYNLSRLDFEIPVCDLGDLISGKSHEDTHYILQELLSICHHKKAVPVVIGGSCDFSFALFSALSHYHREISYTNISAMISLNDQGEGLNEKNYLARILGSKNFPLRDYHHMAYQKHLNELDSVKLMKEVEFDVIRLAEMMGSTENTEPYFRRADLVTVNCDSVEGPAGSFSVNPQVNGLNRREVCAYMKEVGLSENLKSVGIFNFNPHSDSLLNQQLLAQMVWHLIEGINIQRSHPKERRMETFYVPVDDVHFAFKRDSFSGLWYFGDDEDVEKLIPCSPAEYAQAKRGTLPARLMRDRI